MSTLGKLQSVVSDDGRVLHEMEIRLDELNRRRTVRGTEPYFVEQRARFIGSKWDELWRRKIEVQNRVAGLQKDITECPTEPERIIKQHNLANMLTEDALNGFRELKNLLKSAVTGGELKGLRRLIIREEFTEPMPEKPERPTKPGRLTLPRKPERSDPTYQVEITFKDKIFPPRRRMREELAEERFKADLGEWERTKVIKVREYEKMMMDYEYMVRTKRSIYRHALEAREEKRLEFEKEREYRENAVLARIDEYLAGDPGAVLDQCDVVLTDANYPDVLPHHYRFAIDFGKGILILDYRLPLPANLPTVKEFSYNETTDTIEEKHIPEDVRNRIFDGIVYQVALRSLFDLFMSDGVGILKSIFFKGFVTSPDEPERYIFSLQADKDEFLSVNVLEKDPETSVKLFKRVRGLGPHTLTPITPSLDAEGR